MISLNNLIGDDLAIMLANLWVSFNFKGRNCFDLETKGFNDKFGIIM